VPERSWVDGDGRRWRFRSRPDVRKDESETHVVLLVESLGETRIVSCRRDEWESAEPHWADLVARSLPEGGSRGIRPSRAPSESESF
jgi:hypothetical protein